MKSRSISLLLCGISAVSMLLAPCAASADDGDGKILRLGWSKDIQTMDVHRTTDNYAVPLNIFDRLLEVQLNDDGSTELVPSIAKEYSVSDDGLTYSFELRDDVKFCDGTPLTSADVEATFTRMFALPESVRTTIRFAALSMLTTESASIRISRSLTPESPCSPRM